MFTSPRNPCVYLASTKANNSNNNEGKIKVQQMKEIKEKNKAGKIKKKGNKII